MYDEVKLYVRGRVLDIREIHGETEGLAWTVESSLEPFGDQTERLKKTPCSAWGKQVDRVRPALREGSPIVLEGLEPHNYKGKDEGGREVWRTGYKVHARTVISTPAGEDTPTSQVRTEKVAPPRPATPIRPTATPPARPPVPTQDRPAGFRPLPRGSVPRPAAEPSVDVTGLGRELRDSIKPPVKESQHGPDF